ncbi:hypothetical protein DFH06DRAFT_699647 [Mycena polygramma]|nr:hypothetical protein DFH06DRAFT_699647 [Mycena polygramma]
MPVPLIFLPFVGQLLAQPTHPTSQLTRSARSVRSGDPSNGHGANERFPSGIIHITMHNCTGTRYRQTESHENQQESVMTSGRDENPAVSAVITASRTSTHAGSTAWFRR